MIQVHINLPDIAIVNLRASGPYSPDIADDLTARAMRALSAAVLAYEHGGASQESAAAESTTEPEQVVL